MSTETDALDRFAQAGDLLTRFVDGPADQSAQKLERIFARAGSRIGNELAKAAKSGETSFAAMVESILQDLARLAVRKVVGNVLEAVFAPTKGSFGGARADGGPVAPGMSYLVGERGPEVFRPAQSGQIETGQGRAPVNVHFHIGDKAQADDFRRSSGQIAAMLGRAVAQGRKRL